MSEMEYLKLPARPTPLAPLQGTSVPERVHVFEQEMVDAVNTALAARRPLLVQGEPGVGKTQLAEAVAHEMKRAFYPFTVDSRSESRDLLWRFDAVQRLADAQLCAAGGVGRAESTREERDKLLRERLDVGRYLEPGPLWWAFDPLHAQRCEAKRRGLGDAVAKKPTELDTKLFPPNILHPEHALSGWVVLIDEIDKADSDLPNGLLEALGARQFDTPARERVEVRGPSPLIIVTSNRERILPDAFLRRCLCLTLELPGVEKEDERTEFRKLIKTRGEAHFEKRTNKDVLDKAADLLIEDRLKALEHKRTPLPGLAEYLDMIRAVVEQRSDFAEQEKLLDTAAKYSLGKHR